MNRKALAAAAAVALIAGAAVFFARDARADRSIIWKPANISLVVATVYDSPDGGLSAQATLKVVPEDGGYGEQQETVPCSSNNFTNLRTACVAAFRAKVGF